MEKEFMVVAACASGNEKRFGPLSREMAEQVVLELARQVDTMSAEIKHEEASAV